MKTKFATIITAVALVFGGTTLTYADSGSYNGSSTELTNVGKINSIEATGNVDVYIMNGDYDAVKVYSDYYGENAVIQNKDGVLHISSYTTDKLMVLVTVNDLHAITASENAFVKSYGDALSSKALIIDLKDKAVGVLNLDAVAAIITVEDDARADLYGTIENFNLDYSASATVNRDRLDSNSERVKEIAQPKPAAVHAMAFGANADFLN